MPRKLSQVELQQERKLRDQAINKLAQSASAKQDIHYNRCVDRNLIQWWR